MKLPYVLILLVILFASLKSPADQSSIGDVKYSILSPDVFISNNPGWVPLNGQPSDVGWAINNLMTFENGRVPDARGRFIRVMNLSQTPELGDPENNRNVGGYQADMIISHQHSYTDRQEGKGPNRGDNGNAIGFERVETGYTGLQANGGSESRPKNITLYIYMKVN